MSKNKSTEPIRTCIVCRRHMAKRLLQRYVWQFETATVVLDGQQNMSGRGAYCCKNETCVERFLNRKQGWTKTFRLH